MKKIYILIDYKGRFETKYTAYPYRSGMDKKLLKKYFAEYGFQTIYLPYYEINFRDENLKNNIFLYSSSEDDNGHYKSYIEDIAYGLELAGAKIIPQYKFLKAHHNKVFMEILRDLSPNNEIKGIHSSYFGTLEELGEYIKNLKNIRYILKPAQGAMSKGVSFSTSNKELINNAKAISRTINLCGEIKDIYRKRKYKGYIPESKFRKKFIIQNMVEGLKGDWKILVYGNKYYVLGRHNRDNDFRASGGGKLFYKKNLPPGLLDFAKKIYESFELPNISIDIGFDENEFYLVEFQVLYFGTYTLEYSEFYFVENEDDWEIIEEKSILEKEYARSMSEYINTLLS